MKSRNTKTYQFGRWLYDPSIGRLTNGKEERLIEMRLNKLLAFLFFRKDEIVTRSEILNDVWAKTVVLEENLTKGIADLRKLMIELPEHNMKLETIHKVGYRLREVHPLNKVAFNKIVLKVMMYVIAILIFIIILIRAINY